MITTCDVAPVNRFPLLVLGRKLLIYKGLLQCSSAPVLYYRMLQTGALARVRFRSRAACRWNNQLEHWSGIVVAA